MAPVDRLWSLTAVVLISCIITVPQLNATPINRQVGISENVYITVQNDTYGIEQRVCSIDSMTYGDGETIPTSSPCEHCICRPPGFACTIISCDYRPGCKAFKRSNQCCPEYQCECEKDGRIYQNGEKIMDSNNPCEICYCQGGEILCAVIDCYWRSDCQPRYIENRCCPLYDHCPPPPGTGPFMRPTMHTTTTASPGFPWFNLSSAVYEVPQRTSPTPIPVYVSSTTVPPTETTTTATSTTPQPESDQLLVMATEKFPTNVHIMASSQEHEEPQVVEVINVDKVNSEITSVQPVKVDPTSAVLVPAQGPTTIFSAPVIAISIIPSSVEQVFLTPEAFQPETQAEIVEEVVPAGTEKPSQVEVEVQSEQEPVVQSTPNLPSQEIVTNPVVETTAESIVEVTTPQVDSVEDGKVLSTSTPRPIEPEIPETTPFQEVVSNEGVVVVEDVMTTLRPETVEEEKPSPSPVEIPVVSTTMSPPMMDPIEVEEEVTPGKPVENIPVPSLEMQPPKQDAIEIVQDEVERTTVPADLPQDINNVAEQGGIETTPSSLQFDDAESSQDKEISPPAVIVASDGQEEEVTTAQTVSQDIEPLLQTEVEVVTEMPEPEATTEKNAMHEVSSPQVAEVPTMEDSQNQDEPEVVTTISPSEPIMPLDDAVQINAEDGEIIVPDKTVPIIPIVSVSELSPEQEKIGSNAVKTENANVNIDTGSFEIISPPENEAEKPEVQNQVMDVPHINVPTGDVVENVKNNEVDVPGSIIHSDDDTIEIYAERHQDHGDVQVQTTAATPVNDEPGQYQDDAIVILPAEDIDDEVIHTDDQHGSVGTTISPSNSIQNDDPVQQDPEMPEVTTIASVIKSEDPVQVEISHDDSEHNDVTEPTPSNGEVPTVSSVPNDEPVSKFRLDLESLEESGEKVPATGTQPSVPVADEVVFDDAVQQVTNNPPNREAVHDEPVVSDVEATTTVLGQSKLRDDSDVTTTPVNIVPVIRGEEIPQIQNFEFDEISSPPATERVLDDEPSTVSPSRSEEPVPVSVREETHPRNEDAEEFTTTKPLLRAEQDFVEVTTNSPSGFAAEYREEIIADQPATTVTPSFKSEIESKDETVVPATAETPVFDEEVIKVDDDITVTTNNYAPKSELDATTVVPENQRDDIEEGDAPVTTTLSPVNETSTPEVGRISIDKMIIPVHGVSLPAVSDDIVRHRSDLSRSDIDQLEGENDSWLSQTAVKHRQIQGLFPSTRTKRLFKSRQPRNANPNEASSSSQPQPRPFKTYYLKKTKKATQESHPQKKHPKRSFNF